MTLYPIFIMTLYPGSHPVPAKHTVPHGRVERKLLS